MLSSVPAHIAWALADTSQSSGSRRISALQIHTLIPSIKLAACGNSAFMKTKCLPLSCLSLYTERLLSAIAPCCPSYSEIFGTLYPNSWTWLLGSTLSEECLYSQITEISSMCGESQDHRGSLSFLLSSNETSDHHLPSPHREVS